MKRTAMSRKPSTRRRRQQEQVKASKKIIWSRCQGRCECCGKPLEEGRWEAAHRIQVGHGGNGDGTVPNLLASCPGPHGCNRRCSDDATFAQLALCRGWIVSRFNRLDPRDIPVTRFYGGNMPVTLGDNGEVYPEGTPTLCRHGLLMAAFCELCWREDGPAHRE